MITVNELVQEFCKRENLPIPDNKTMVKIGLLCSQTFRQMTASSYEPDLIILNAGFKCIEINGKKTVVAYYPDHFRGKFNTIIYEVLVEGARKSGKQASRADHAPAGQDTRKSEERPVKRKRIAIQPGTRQVIKVGSSKIDMK